MTAPVTTTPGSSAASTSTSAAAVDASCRLPLFALLGGAAFWLVLSSVFGLIAGIKFHQVTFLADCAWLSYGRVYPAWSNLLMYGFCIPAGLGVGLWVLARLGRQTINASWLVAFAAKLWHVGVLVGLLGILSGDSTGFDWFEMPRYAAVILFLAFLLIAVWGFINHAFRPRCGEEMESPHGEPEAASTSTATLYPSQWFVLSALFWFLWIYATAGLLLLFSPVRGVVQVSVGWWYVSNLLVVWTGLAGLGAAFYFLPALGRRPLQSHYTAMFAFLTLILFGTWAGVPANVPLPAWMPALSGVATLAILAPTLAVGVIGIQTLRGADLKSAGAPLSFLKFGVLAFVLSGLMLAATGVTDFSRLTEFTWFGHAQNTLRLYGFFAMTMFGAVYYLLPRVAGIEFPFARLIRLHFWFGAVGVLCLAIPLAIGGVVQGLQLANPDIKMVDVVNSTLMYFRVSTLGDTLIALGNLLFLLNLLTLIGRYYRSVVVAAYTAVTARLDPVEVKS